MKFWISILFPLALHASPYEDVKEPIFLYDYRTNKTLDADLPLKSNRVYVRFDSKFDKWVMVLTDKKGRLPEPGEGLATGTILKGTAIGVSAEAKYKLEQSARWFPTLEPEVTKVLVAGSPHTLITIARGPVAGEKLMPSRGVASEPIDSTAPSSKPTYLKPKLRKPLPRSK